MEIPAAYPITAAELARILRIDGKQLRDVLRAHPELVPGHAWGEHYRIDRQTQRGIERQPEVQALLARKR
jgi:hypothetical protein